MSPCAARCPRWPSRPAYTAAGAGTPSANGAYYLAGSYNGQQDFQIYGGDFLYFNSTANKWAISASLGGTDIYRAHTAGSSQANITGTWDVVSSGGPAPTVVAG